MINVLLLVIMLIFFYVEPYPSIMFYAFGTFSVLKCFLYVSRSKVFSCL